MKFAANVNYKMLYKIVKLSEPLRMRGVRRALWSDAKNI